MMVLSYVDLVKEKSTFSKIKENIPKKEYINSVIGSLTFWNGFQYINYEYVPHKMQTPAVLAVSTAWVTLLSLWTLKGSRKITNENKIVQIGQVNEKIIDLPSEDYKVLDK